MAATDASVASGTEPGFQSRVKAHSRIVHQTNAAGLKTLHPGVDDACVDPIVRGANAVAAARARWRWRRSLGRGTVRRNAEGARTMPERARTRTAERGPAPPRPDHLFAYDLRTPLRIAARGQGV